MQAMDFNGAQSALQKMHVTISGPSAFVCRTQNFTRNYSRSEPCKMAQGQT